MIGWLLAALLFAVSGHVAWRSIRPIESAVCWLFALVCLLAAPLSAVL